MNIRSLTGFLSLSDPLDDAPLRAFRDMTRAARADFARADLPVQTTRIATQPVDAIAPRDLKKFALDLQAAAQANDIAYVSLGAPRDWKSAQDLAPAIAATESIFGALHLASHADGISFGAIQAAARIMYDLGRSTPDGFGNLRFAALANVSPHSPYFPAAHHDGTQPAFAIAVEGAPLAVQAFAEAKNLDEARTKLVNAIEQVAQKIVAVAQDIAKNFSFRFAGIDFSMAPYPDDAHSIGAAMEKLTGAKFGEHGTLFASAFITDCIHRAQFPRVGFSGLMLPVLEDSVLGARTSLFTVHSLLLYSSVCGTGLDTIPLPGETTQDELAAILLDLATLAVKLNKPLTARLLPIPGLKAGDPTNFSFEFFTRAHVMKTDASALKFLATDQTVKFV